MLLDVDGLFILVVDELITLEVGIGRLDLHLAAVALATQVELLHGDGQELSVRADVGRHRHLRVLNGVGLGKGLQAFWRIADGRYRNVFDDQVGEFEIWLGVLWAEVNLEVDGFAAADLTLGWLNAVVSLLVLKRDLLLVLRLVDRPVERHEDWRAVTDTNRPLRLGGRVRILKVDGLERVLFEVDLFAVNSYDVQVDHGAITGQFVEF